MKNVMMIILCAAMAFTQSCSKEGLDGKDGTNGTNGTNGQNGVSGARAFTFENKSLPINETITIDRAFVDSSAAFVYYVDPFQPNSWFHCPGYGPGSVYFANFFIDRDSPTKHNFAVRLRNPNGTAYAGLVTFNKVKIVFIPHTLMGKKEAVDYNDYNAVAKYYGLKD